MPYFEKSMATGFGYFDEYVEEFLVTISFVFFQKKAFFG